MKERGILTRKGPDGEVLHPVDGTIYIGSRDCDVIVKDAAPRQCQIVRTAEGFLILDLTGQKVTQVNGARTERHLLREGETVKIGTAEFTWSVTLEVEPEPIGVPAPKRRMGATTSSIKKISGATTSSIKKVAEPEKSHPWIPIAAVAGGAIVVIIVLAVVFSRSSNADRSIARRDSRPARSDTITPRSGAAREGVPVEPSAPRQDGVVIPATPEPAKTVEPAPIVINPVKPLFPEMPAVTPGAPGKAEARVRSPIEQRYAALLASLDRTLARGWGYEAMYKEILESSAVAPKNMAEHLKALAQSLKDAVACRECAGGKVGCEKCGGKGRVDLDCSTCQGQGRVRASGAVGDADVTVKCRNCDGKRVFRGVTCPSCARSGKTACASCRGNVWPADRCPRPECNAGRVPCPTCNGKAFVMEKCPFCVNGRQKAPGAVNGADVTMKCRNCEIDGQHGTGKFKTECKTCSKTGKVTCDHCGGAFGNKKPADGKDKSVETGSKGGDGRDKPVEISLKAMVSNKVYTVEKCGQCSGSGCDRCLGIGWRIRPVSDPSRIIE